MAATATTGNVTSTVTDMSIDKALEPGLRAGLLQIGDRAVAELMVALSVPVEYVGSQVIRSDPGQLPRMETDALRQSTDSNILPGEPFPKLRVSVGPRPGGDPDAAEVLEFGGVSSWGNVKARPYMTPQMGKIQGYAATEIGNALKRHLGKA